MERLLLLRLQSTGCAAEARVNDIPVARTPAGGGLVILPVHEYLLEGANHLAITVEPALPGVRLPPRISSQPLATSLKLLLPRIGHLGSPDSARTLAELDWALPEGELVQSTVAAARQVVLPVSFARWRWLDLPPVPDLAAVHDLLHGFVHGLALALAKGDADAFAQQARLRFEELGLAYQQAPADLLARWRSRLQLLQATKALQVPLSLPADLLLRPCAGGRLVECLGADGEPILRTLPAPDGSRQAWPIRVAVVDGRCHVMR